MIRTPNLQKVKVPSIEHYGGTTDPNDHLTTLKEKMSVQTGREFVWCKFFPTTLTRLALTWFTELPHGSISHFAFVEIVFKQNFIARRIHHKTNIH